MSTDSDASDQSLPIQQNVQGDRSQVIGQAIDSTIVNFAGEGQVIHLTIHDRVPEQSAPPPIHEIKPLTQQDYRQRQILLSKVRDYWVKGVLEKSLHARVLIELGLQKRLDLVRQPFSGVDEFTEVSGQALPQGTDATKVFDHMTVGRTLLILGEPGSGKTITLLKLAQDLLARTETDLRQPIPVVLNLSSWVRKTQTIAQWLVQELLEKYQVSKALGKTWVETEALILLLDGLDEVKAEQRNACVRALNQFMQTHSTTELTICCRIRDYQALAEQLRLRSAVCIQPLTPEQIEKYFEQTGEQLRSLKIVLHQDEELQRLATSPLMLSIMSLAYQGCASKDIIQGSAAEDYHQRLFDTYIDRMFQRRGTTQQYSRQQTQHWLIWLAQRMTDAAQTVFLIERLQPSWLPNRGQRIRFRLESSLIVGMILGLTDGLIVGLNGGLVLGLSSGLTSGLIAGLIVSFFEDIQPVETVKWSWKVAWQSIKLGFRFGLIGGPILGLSFGLIGGPVLGLGVGLISGLIVGLIVGLVLGLIVGLFGGFRGSEIHQKEKPNQSIRLSLRNAIILGMSFGLILGLIRGLFHGLINELSFGLNEALSFGLSVNDGLILGLNRWLSVGPSEALFFVWSDGPILGLIVGLLGGGSACIRHLALRLMLYRSSYSPWNYAHFLDYAAERLFLQKIGGGYIFVHRMLLEHFAAMPLEQEKH